MRYSNLSIISPNPYVKLTQKQKNNSGGLLPVKTAAKEQKLGDQ